ncbi:hotdog fold thioesterase [Paenarthrobacter sp. Z7-10]|uniref:PaaI family thioesterase n=1 Tax=Paenarthrobacter sp. Z7-10 TaxID=2787635 RepID=UPI0022A91AF7|nr:hotdog fold thioesterase [Paenarthrobacter sp. Z7-10]MCZ2402326.1 hotdog fold thioesterase [Paenarthrobacter sp. Z7-10]
MATTSAGTAHPMLTNDHASAWMGIEVTRLDDGHATIQMTLRREMMNGFGMAHGGMIFAFADTAFALACNPADGDGSSMTVAAGADVNFLKSSREGQLLTAVADRRAKQGRSGLYDVQVFAGDPSGADLLAEFRGRSRTVPRKG